MRILGVVVFALLGGAFFAGLPNGAPSFGAFIDAPSAILVLGGVLGILLLSHDVDSWKLLGRFLLRRSDSFRQNDRETLTAFLQTASRGSLAFGGLGTLIGLIIILWNLEDPSQIGPGLAVAILTILYALLLSELVVQPMRRILMQKPGPFAETIRNTSVSPE